MLAKFNAIKRLLEKGGDRVPNNKTWQAISVEYEVGRVVGKEMCLTHNEKRYLRQLLIDETGFDPLGEKIEGDRIALAARTTNEKLSRESVFGSLVQIARFDNKPIQITGSVNPTFTPPGTVLSARPESISARNLDSVLVVENGQSMLHWNNYNFPPEVRDSLIVYRGHGANARWVSDIVATEKSATCHAFYDCDPKGLHLALSQHFDSLILPKDLISITEDQSLFKKVNKVQSFYDQHSSVKALQKFIENPEISDELRSTIKLIMDKSIAITQETMLAHSLELKVFNVKETDL